MLKGQGTQESPLLSTPVRLMDLSLMQSSEGDEEKIVIIIEFEEDNELYALSFNIEDIKELVSEASKVLEDG